MLTFYEDLTLNLYILLSMQSYTCDYIIYMDVFSPVKGIILVWWEGEFSIDYIQYKLRRMLR
jgi:hypothetical protein